MRIACLAWGSLVWSPRDLQISSIWFEDGPSVPVEFARQSGGHRLTLVIRNDFQPVTSLWAWMKMASLPDAVENLRVREGTVTKRIGVWKVGQTSPKTAHIWEKNRFRILHCLSLGQTRIQKTQKV